MGHVMSHFNDNRSITGQTMKSSFFLIALALAATGCNKAGDDLNRVQTNLVDKSIFEGEWWYGQTAIDVQSDSESSSGVFSGEMAWADMGIDRGESGSIARIRWVIDEDTLFAYRAYELIEGGNDDGRDENFRGQPVAAWRVSGHVDIRKDYNPATGEETNVTVENASDRRWYERRYMRVDWSKNIISSYQWSTLEVGPWYGYRREPADFFFQENAHGDFPSSYYPTFVRVAEDPDYRFASEWPADMNDTVHYMSFVTQQLLSPGAQCLFDGSPCQTYAITTRHSFMRVPPNHQYASSTETHGEFDHFGLIRNYQRTYVRGGQSRDQLGVSCSVGCTSDAECGIGGTCGGAGTCTAGLVDGHHGCNWGTCDVGAARCVGGLTSDQDETDFLVFYTPRYNLWSDPLTDTACRADRECSAIQAGSECDRASRRCTVPVQDRTTRRVTYHLNPGFPAHLAPDAFEVIGQWNGVFMEGWRAARDMPVPDYSVATVSCQTHDPTDYCYCGGPEDRGGSCPGVYDPFVSPADYASRGVTAPFDCQIVANGWTEPTNPTSVDAYAGAFDQEFVGDECLLVLHPNDCNVNPEAACQELGDIRYQFFNYIDHVSHSFSGVSIPLMDPTSGELIVSNANMAGESLEGMVLLASEYFPVLRDEPGAQERWFTGEDQRGYFARLGQTEHPVALAPGGADGEADERTGRPASPISLNTRLLEHVAERVGHIEQLRGSDGRAQIMSDRMRELAGTDWESRIVGSMGHEGVDLLHMAQDARTLPRGLTAMEGEQLDQLSPFRGGLLGAARARENEVRERGRRFMCDFKDMLFSDANYGYYAEKFRGVDVATTSIRLQQWMLRMVMLHEMGHSLGLMHNFGASLDRNNYHDGYFNLVMEEGLALPRMEDYDDPRFDGDADGFVGGEEVGRYLADLREVRDERARRGMYRTISASTMDYTALSPMNLGRYDRAALAFSYYGLREAYTADPRISSADSLDGLHRTHEVDRTWWRYYRGGDACRVDDDCPGSAAAGQSLSGQGITQRCIRNPRFSRLPAVCGAGEENCVCSPFDEDFKDYVDGVAFRDPDSELAAFPVLYQYCNDSRTNDISWCTLFDHGESFQESVDEWRRMFQQRYPQSYFRRFNYYGARGGASWTGINAAAKVYQHLFFRLFFEPGFDSNTGPLGFNDQFLASVDAMNYFIELANLPNTGSYSYNDALDMYEHIGDSMDMAGSDFSLAPGAGFQMWTQYQDGHQGWFRREVAGTYLDKMLAMYALALRDWGLSFTADERYFINFYDLFDIEMTEFFGGMILNDPHWFAPRITMAGSEPRIENMNWYRGLTLGECRDSRGRTPCEGARDEVYPDPPIGGTSANPLRSWALINALATFPVYYDTRFEQQATLFKLDNGDGRTLPARQPDGTPTCAYAPDIDGDGIGDGVTVRAVHELCTDREEADYVVYVSDRFHTPYVATKVRSRLTYNLEEEQLGFQMLARMVEVQNRINELAAESRPSADERAELAALRNQLVEDETFIELWIDLQRRFGISSIF